MKAIFLVSVLLLSALIIFSCKKDNLITPQDNQHLEYNWSIDTLINPNGYGVVPWSIWGSSDSSVWIAGFNLAGQGELFHWNGNLWRRVTPDLGYNYDLSAIIGFADNDVYIAGYKIIIDTIQHSESIILHYDGSRWQQETISLKGDGLLYIGGENPSDIWACGKNGTLYSKIGGNWIKLPFDEREYLGLLSKPPDLGPIYVSPNGDVFLMNEYYNYQVYNDTAMFYFSKYSNGTWQDLDSCRLVNVDGIPTGFTFGNKAMYGVTENQIYSVANSELFKFDGSNWTITIWDDYLYRDIKGTSKKLIFTVGDHGTIRYFNGSSWIRIGDFGSYIVDFYSVMPFGDNLFIGAYQLGVGYVVRGKVKR